MNAQALQGQWNQLRGKLKEQWADLTDDDMKGLSGNIDQLIGRIQERTGESREKIENTLHEMSSKASSVAGQATEAVSHAVNEAAGQFRGGFDEAADRLGEGYEQSRRLIRDNPGQAMMAGVGVGLVLGLFVGMALRNR